jgi:putative flippase GtrA
MLNCREHLFSRYLINGVVATLVHFLALTVNVEVVHFRLVGNANLVAALIASAVAFFGNRFYVFQKSEESMLSQAIKFGGLYVSLACLHGLVLFMWSDFYQLDYRVGFVLVILIQLVIGYFGNKHLVFKI